MAGFGVINVNGLITRLVTLLAFLLPFGAVGVEVSGALLSISTFVGVFLVAVLIGFNLYVINSRMLLLIALIGWFFLTAAFRFPLSTYVQSLIVFFLMSFPVVASLEYRVNSKKVVTGLMWGFLITISITIVEMLGQSFGSNIVSELIFYIAPGSRSQEFLGYSRAKAFMLEPAHLAIYFCFIYVIFDVIRTQSHGYGLVRFLSIVGILCTFSLGGIILITSYLFVRYGRIVVSGFLSRRSISFRSISWMIFVIPLILVVLFVFRNFFLDFSALITRRFLEISSSLTEEDYVGSIGSRSNTLSVMIEYWREQWPAGAVFGTGYANYQDWLVESYGHLGMLSAFARGQINSIFAAVGLSTGIVGLGLYIMLLVSLIRRYFIGYKLEIWAFLVAVHLAYGTLVGYFLWHSLMLMCLLVISRRIIHENEDGVRVIETDRIHGSIQKY